MKNGFNKLWIKFKEKNRDRKNNWVKAYFYKYSYKKLGVKKNILDIGCGVGHFLELDKKNIIGIDKNFESLLEGEKNCHRLVRGDILELPFTDASFDGINCSHVIEHFHPDNAYNLLSEMNRVLKVGGIIAISAPVFGKHFYNDLTHVRPYYPEAIMHYYDETKVQRTKNKIKCHYELDEIKWRYEKVPLKPVLFPKAGILNTLIILLTEWISNAGIGKYVQTGYTMILKKIR